MHRLTTVILACALPFAAWGESAAGKAAPAWIERSNTYTNTLLGVQFAHTPERGSRQGLARYDQRISQPTLADEQAERRELEAALGAKFQQRKFHDFILSQGLLPPDLMRKAVIEEFVPAQK